MPSQPSRLTPSNRLALSSNQPLSHSLHFEAIGTAWCIDTIEPLPLPVQTTISELIERFDSTWSRFRDDSLVTRISCTTGTWVLPAEAGPMFSLYRALYDATDGAVTPLVGRALENLGYDRNYSLRATGVATSVPHWDDTFQWNGRALTTHTPTLLDVGAAGKGYLVDLVATTLTEAGIAAFIIDASGDIVHAGPASIRVALEHPRDSTKAIGVLELRDGALCASSTSRRAWGDGLHHIIDPVTGLPTSEVIATWVRAGDGLTADGLATALFFVDAARLTGSFDFTFARMFNNGRVEHSPDFDGELFL
jgi:thiamine biosynthesis lipoprotein